MEMTAPSQGAPSGKLSGAGVQLRRALANRPSRLIRCFIRSEFLERDRGGEDVQAVVGDQHVLLETHAAEALHLVDAAPVDAVAAAFSGEQRGTT
jgi:hypothetical protein